MRRSIVILLFANFVFTQILEIDSIIDPGTWTNPESILVSDDFYGLPAGNQDVVTLSIYDPLDTINLILDSVKVLLEQHVSDITRAFWYVTPVINGIQGTATPQQAGSLVDSVLYFDISADITGWSDLYDFNIELHPRKGTGAPPLWYADYLCVYAYSTTGIGEEGSQTAVKNPIIFTPTIVRGSLIITCGVDIPLCVSIKIYNTAGASLIQKNMYPAKSGSRIVVRDVAQLRTGVYFVIISTLDGRYNRADKFIVLN